jgi:hypothetical protein
MVWRNLTLAMLLVPGTAGCSGSPSKPVASPTVTEMADGEPSASLVDTATATAESGPAADEPVAAIRPTEGSSDPDTFVPAFPGNDNYFSPPPLESVETQTVPDIAAADAESARPPIAVETLDLRVLGFVQVAGEPPRAMFHLDGKLELAGAGDRIGDLEVVSVNEPDVCVRHAGEELRFALGHRAAVGAGEVAQRERGFELARQTKVWPQVGRPATDDGAGRVTLPVDFASLPTAPESPQVELPEIELPDVPMRAGLQPLPAAASPSGQF